MTDNPGDKQQRYNPNFIRDLARKMAEPKRVSYQIKEKPIDIPYWSPYYRPPTGDYTSATGRPYWSNPQRIARAKMIADAMPPGYEMPTWMPDRDTLDVAFDYLATTNVGKPWYEWTDDLADDDPLMGIVAGLPAPEGHGQVVPSVRQVMTEYGITYDDMTRLGVTEEDLLDAYRYDMGVQQANQEAAAQGGEIGTDEWDRLYDELLTKYDNDVLIQWARTNGLDPREVEKMKQNKSLWWQAPATALFRTKGGQMGQQAINLAIGGAGVSSVLGMGPIPGMVAGGAAGSWMGQIAWDEQQRMAEQGDAYTPSAGYKLLMVLNAAFEGLEIGITIPQLWSALIERNRAQSVAEGKDPASMDNVTNAAAELAEMIYDWDWDAIKATGILYYSSLPQTVAYQQAWGEYARGGYQGEAPSVEFKRYQLGTGDPETIQINQLPILSAYQDVKELIAQGYTPREAADITRTRFGFGGEMTDLVAGYLLDPLDLIGPLAKGIGIDIADASGNATLAHAFNVSSGPVEALRNYGALLRTGAGTDARTRIELGNADWMTRYLAGVDKQGNLLPVRKFKLADPRTWFALRPAAIANEVLSTNVTNLSYVLMQKKTVEDMNGAIRGIAGISPEQAARITEDMPWLQAPIGGTLPGALRDFGRTLDTMEAAWNANTPNRNLILRMAKDLDMTPGEFLAQYYRQGEALFQRWADNLQGKPNSESLLAGIQDGSLSYQRVKTLVDGFMKDTPLTADDYRAHLLGALTSHVDKWAADFYQVKPDPAWQQFSHAIKSTQSLLLLGLNPTYAINNVINNRITMAWGMVLGLRGKKQINDFWQRFEVQPARLRAAIGGAAGFDDANTGAAIRGAGQAHGLLAEYVRLYQENRLLGKMQVVTRLAQAEERGASAQAYTAGTQRAWRRLWKRGRGYDVMPHELENALRAIDPSLPALIYAGIDGTMNLDELNALLWEGVQVRTLDRVLPDAAAYLRRAGIDMDEAGIREALEHTGVYSYLQTALNEARTPEQAAHVLRETRSMVADWVDQQFIQHRHEVARRAVEVAQAEGVAGVLDVFDQLYWDLDDFWIRHYEDWEKVHQTAASKDRQERRRLFRQQRANSRAEWARMNDMEDATLRGTLEGLGADDTDITYIDTSLMQRRHVWNEFFDELNRMQDEYFDTDFGNDRTAASNAWAEVQSRLDDLYVRALAAEDAIQVDIDNVFARLLERQGQSVEAGLAWRRGVRAARSRMGKAMREHRQAMLQIPPDEKLIAWRQFIQAEYKPLIHELRTANLEDARRMYGVNMPAGTRERAPLIERKTIQQLWDEVLVPAGIAGRNEWMAILPSLNGARGDGVAPFTEMDIYTTPTLDRWNQIVDSLNRFGEQGRQNTPPPELPPAPRTERRRPENAATRRAWDAMTDDERYYVTHHDQRTGIPNGRAFLEAVLDTDKNATLPVVIYVDGRGLKWWNEGDGDQRIPHEAGDRVIDAIAVAIRDETPEGYRLHDSGDEFVMRFATQEEAEAAIARVRERIRNSVIEVQYTDGTTRYYRGADIAYGIGEADYANIGQPETIYRAADTDRAARREAGPTERRGEKPAGVEEVTQPDSESYTDLDAEVGANETITPSGEDIIYRIASTYGLYSINNDLTPVRGFTRHVLNIVQKYGGEAGKAIKSWDELIAYVDQHGTAILRQAFETRRRAKEGQGNLPEQPELVQTAVRRFQARQAIGKIWSEQQGDWIAKPDPETMRTLFVEDLYNAFNDGSQDPQVIRDQVDASVTLMDAHAAVWARLNGRQVVDWWNEQLAGFMSKDNAMQLLNAEQASDALQSNAGAFAYRLEDGRMLIAALERPDASTIPHELAHLFVQDLPAEDVSQYTRWLMDEYGVEARWDGARKRFVTDRTDNVPGPLGSPMPADEFVNEMFAVGFEKYLAEGKAPSAGLRGVFQKFKAWLLQIYRNLNTGKMRRIKLSDTMRDVYARMLATGDDLPQKPAYWHNAPTSPTFALGADPNNRYDFNLRVVSLDDLIASHTDTLAENPDFPAELQPRQRDRAASEVQINNIIAQFVPDDLLIDFHVLERGPMIIGSDLIVESGNGRAIALRKMQSSHPAKWYAYQTALARRVQELGLSTEGIPNPVLVRERASTVNRVEFANEANNQSTMTASALEVARNDARLVTDEALINLVIQPDQNIDQAIRSRENVQFVKDFVADLPKNQQSTIMAAGGELSAEGLQRIKNAIIARVFTGEAGERITRVFLESPEVEIKNIQNAVYGALPALARMDGQLKLGTRDADLAITNDLAAAVDMYARLRAQGTSVKNYLQNIGLFETELTEFQRMLLRYLDANARSTNRIRNLITGYAELVMMQPDPNQMDLFGDVRLTKGELLDVAARKLGTDTEFASAEDAAPVPGGGGIKVTKDITGNEPSIVPETPRITIPDTRMDDEQLANYARALVRQGDEAIRLALSDEGDEGKARLQAAIDKERGTQEPAQAGNQADTGIEEAKSYIGQFRKLPGGRVGRIVGVLIKDGAHTGYVFSLSDGTFRPYRDMKTTAFIGDDVNNIKQVATPGNANKFPDRLTDRSIIPDGYIYEEAAPIDPGAESLITLGWSRLVHKGEGRKALEAGEDVPPEVLADYPDLVQQQPAAQAAINERGFTISTEVESAAREIEARIQTLVQDVKQYELYSDKAKSLATSVKIEDVYHFIESDKANLREYIAAKDQDGIDVVSDQLQAHYEVIKIFELYPDQAYYSRHGYSGNKVDIRPEFKDLDPAQRLARGEEVTLDEAATVTPERAEAAVEPEAPAAVTAEPEQPQPQTHALADPTTQPTFFDQSAEDMPLFSETPMTAEESAFTATEPGAKQPGLLEERPAFTPTSRVLDVTIVGAGVNKRVRLSLDDVAAIRKLADENKGAEVSWRIVSQDGDIQYKVGKDLKDLLPDVPEGQDALFQTRTDTPEFREWFGDSKVVDQDGQPLVVYHGTFNEFDGFEPSRSTNAHSRMIGMPLFFFAASEGVAQSYGDITMPAYLRMERPMIYDAEMRSWDDVIEDIQRKFETYESEEQRAFFEYKDEIYADGREYDDLTAGERERLDKLARAADAARVNRIRQEGAPHAAKLQPVSSKYDGMIIMNVWDMGIANLNNNYSPYTTVYAVTDPTQIKSVDNVGTFDPQNPNIYFQRRRRDRGTFDPSDPNILFQRPLVARHNLTEQNLIDADRLGGMPVPSIAITPGEVEFSSYGPITLVGRRPMIDPERSRLNEVYGGDAYSPVAPRQVWAPVPRKLAEKIMERLRAKAKINSDADYDMHINMLWDYMVNDPNKDRAMELATREGGSIRRAFLSEQGITVPIVMRPVTQRHHFSSSPEVLDFVRSQPEDASSTSYREGLTGAYLQAIERHAREKLAERKPDYTQEDVKRYIDSATNGYVGSDGILYFAKADSIAMDARAIIRGEQTTDIMATDKAIQSEFTPELEAKYQRWVRELLSVFKEPLIEVGRKKVEVNLVNLVDAMTRKATRGGEGGMTHASPGRVRSYLARKFKSIAEMHKFEDALVSEKQFHEWEESGDLETLAHTFAEDAMRHSRGSSGNEFIDYDRARNLLLEAARSRKISREGLRSIGSMYGYNLSDLGIEAGYQYLRTLSNAPTEYFEAKPQRAVYFDEFAGAVVPEGVDPKVIEILERRGIEYRTYPMRDDAARQAAVESFYDQPDVLFQRRRRDRVTVEPVTDPNARHGDMRIVGNVYWSEGRERRLIAYLPERYDVGEWRDSQRGRFRIVGLDPQDANYWIIELEGGGFTRFNPGETEANAINAPVGSVDAGNPNPPIAQASAEYARNTINPILDALERNIMTADRQPRSIPGAREMPERTQRMYRTWASKVQGQMSSAKLAATRMGEGYRDAALLNYTRKTNLDSMLEVIFPYQFWYTRTMLNWMGRFLDKPSILTNYYRFRQMQERHKRDGFPTRLEGKIGIPFPFLPEGMGDALYVDPMKQIFPWENFSRPLDKIADEQNTVEKKAVSILGRWAEERTYDPAAVQNALDTKKGELWEAALAEAKQSSELNYDDPLSLVSAVMTPSLPLYWAALALTGQEDKISQLPFTRMVQAMTGLAGVGEPGGVNLEKGIRQTLDMPEVDRWQDYRIDREIANMAADGRITPEEAVEAMVSRQGEVFDQARSRVGTQQGVRWLFSAFLADLYPEGEKTQRQNADEYYQAIEKWTSGDTDAMQKFYDEHPDYEARMAALRDPQERLKSYLISEVWDRWNEADRVTKKAAAEQLGDMFNQAFLDKETRSYDAIDTETLAYWAKMLGGDMIEGTPTVPEGTALHVPPPELRQEVESFYTERDAKFPNIGDWIGVSQGTEMTVPIVDQYYEWRTDWLAEHPDAIPYILGDDNDLTGLPNNIQSVVFKYRSLRQNLYPNIFELQEQYFNIAKGDNAGRKAYRQQYPELEEYWEWRKAYAAQHPEAASYILGEDSLADMIAGGNAYNSKTTPELDEQSMAMFSQELRLALTRKVYANTPLGQGAWKEINFIWKALGEPGGSMASWMSDTVLPAFGR